MTHITPILSLLARAGRSRHILYTLAPDERRPPRITIEAASGAEVVRFVEAVDALIGAVPAPTLDHLAVVLDEVIGRAVARWADPRAEHDPWYHSRAARNSLDAAAGQDVTSPHRRSALVQATACAVVAIADWDRRHQPGESGEVPAAACADGLGIAAADVLQAYQPPIEMLDDFVQAWCDGCRNDSAAAPCQIFTSGLLYTPAETGKFPIQWVSGARGANPRCTAFAAKETAHV